MIRAIWISAAASLIATYAMFRAPAGETDPLGTLLRTAGGTALLAVLGRFVGMAKNRRPPSPVAARVVATILATVTLEVASIWLVPGWWSSALVWYLGLFAAGMLFNHWCQAPARYAVSAAVFTVVAVSVILMAISAARPLEEGELTNTALLLGLWPNITRIASNPVDAAWTWLAWRLTDRLRPRETRKARSIWRIPARRPQPRRPPARRTSGRARSRA